MRASVIFTTYNSPEWLQKVLWGFEQQTAGDFEILIADDGSGEPTRELIERFQRESALTIRHVWHEDAGFRKCRILNLAIRAARSDYVIFTDGDCIPREDFVAVHLDRRAPGHWLSGSYCMLPMDTSKAIARDDIVSGDCFDHGWLRRKGMPLGRKTLKLLAPRGWPARLLNRLTPTRCRLKGANASAWREDLLRVNGFDERMVWGGLDRELGVRLNNAGVQARHVRFDAILVHLDHSRGYKDPERVAANKRLRQQVEREGIARTDHGIAQLDGEAA